MHSFVKNVLISSVLMSTVVVGAVYGAPIQQIEIKGNQRIEGDTILLHAGLKIGDNLDQHILNQSLKALFDTNLFADASIRAERSKVIITVVENPIINQVIFEGNKRITEEMLKAEVGLKPRDIYTRNRVQGDMQRILSLYRRQGRFAATVEPKIVKLDQNRVDLIFEVVEGPVTGVKKIIFMGNHKFSTSTLMSTIRTKESRWFRFLTSDDTYDPERLIYDRELLRQFYLEHGYVDFKVLSSVAELSPDKSGFYITFTLDEGHRYRLRKVDVHNELKDLDLDALKRQLQIAEKDWFNGKQIEKTIDTLTDYIGNHGYAFVQVEPHFERIPETTEVDVTFDVKEGPRVYVGAIDIEGNLATYDKVIRREFRLAEGDAYNTSKLRRSEQRLRDLDFFSEVKLEKEQGDAPDRVNLKTTVKEKSTGEISISGGVTTYEGLIGQLGFSERNFMGKGQELSSSFTLSRRTREFDISFTEPYFLDKNLSAGIDLFKVRYDQTHQSGYIHNRQGSSIRLGYHITEPLIQRLRYTFRQDVVSGVKDDASLIIREQKGARLTSMVGQELIYDKRNSRIVPTEGYMLSLSNEFAGVGGNTRFLRHIAEAKYYYPVTDDLTFSLRGSGGLMQKLNQPIKVIDRFLLGGETLRGFEFAGIGPRENTRGEALGGRLYYTGSAELTFPIGLPNELGIKGSVFSDIGSLWKADTPSADVKDSKKMRASVGFGVAWASPLGPMRLDFGKALRYEKYDKRQVVLFSFRTVF